MPLWNFFGLGPKMPDAAMLEQQHAIGEKIVAALVKVVQDNADKRLYVSSSPRNNDGSYIISLDKDKPDLSGFEKRLIGQVKVLLSKSKKESCLEIYSGGYSDKKYYRKDELDGFIDIIKNYIINHKWETIYKI